MIHRQSDGVYLISSRQVWVPGIYADERAARYAFRFTDQQLQALQDSINPDGVITSEMLRGLRNAKEAPGNPLDVSEKQGA